MKLHRQKLFSENEVPMIFSFRVAQISVADLARRRETDDDFLMMDVREAFELQMVKLDDDRVRCIPLSELARKGTDALPEDLQGKDKEIIVFCQLRWQLLETVISHGNSFMILPWRILVKYEFYIHFPFTF